MPTRQAPAGEPLDDFLDDWRIHLGAKNRALGTIESYLTVGEAFCTWLDPNAVDSRHTAITRNVLELYLARCTSGSPPPQSPSTTALWSGSSAGSSGTVGSTAPPWRR